MTDEFADDRNIHELTAERANLEDELTRLREHEPWSQAVAVVEEKLDRLFNAIQRAAS